MADRGVLDVVVFTLGTYLGIPSLLDVLDWTHSGKRDAALAPHKRGKEGRREGGKELATVTSSVRTFYLLLFLPQPTVMEKKN